MATNVMHRVQVVGVKQDGNQCDAQSSGGGSEARWQPMCCIEFRWLE